MPTTFVAFDLETTGFSARDDRIVEVGGVRFDASGEVLGTFESLVRPGRPCSASAYAAHRLADAELASAPPPREVLPRFREFLGGCRDTILVAHNARFDLAFLRVAGLALGLAAINHDVQDTLDLARRRWPRFESHRLPALSDRLGFDVGLDGARHHRALADADRCRLLWLRIRQGF